MFPKRERLILEGNRGIEPLRIISQRALVAFWSQPAHRTAELPLRVWWARTRKAHWQTPQDVKRAFPSASFVANNRVVFNIGGNKYRLVVKFRYDRGIGYVRFVGTHAAYDQIDVEKV